ncbi:MAG: response regulator [Desulfovibrionaceae bacterium]|nr:response regulator [Desulfovibrionaceae bacterium]
MRVLLVDDEVEFLELMKKRLSRRGFEVFTANEGSKALNLIAEALKSEEAEAYKVVVLDVRMPGMDGLETLRGIKKIAPALPVILLTGHAAVGIAMEGLELGAFDYMLKPVPIEDLISKMEEAVQSA